MKKALFLDRDGVINEEKDYLYKKDDFVFIDGIIDLCKHYQELGYLIIVVTNQSGIARGYYSQSDFRILTLWMIEEFKKNSINITKVYHCPHHPDIDGACSCRKPNPGMLYQAKDEFNIDMQHSLIIGDKERDVEAGLNAGLGEAYLLVESTQSASTQNSKATRVVENLKEIWR